MNGRTIIQIKPIIVLCIPSFWEDCLFSSFLCQSPAFSLLEIYCSVSTLSLGFSQAPYFTSHETADHTVFSLGSCHPGPQLKSLPPHLRIDSPAIFHCLRGTWRSIQTYFLLFRGPFHRSSFIRLVTIS